MNDAACACTRDDNGESGAARTVSRENLYALVWETPMTRLAKTFGLSDVGLRKICVRHDIPTPPLGYWAKIAHGKRVHKPPLPPAAGPSDRVVLLEIPFRPKPPAIAAAQDAALEKEATHPRIVVPAERPVKLHPVAAATAKSLQGAKADHEGFKHGCAPGGVAVCLGAASIDRAVRLIDAFARAAEARGHSFAEDEHGVRFIVDGTRISWRLSEIKERGAHTPTPYELKEQARREEDRARWPSLYGSRNTKVYRLWDHFPSGRLSMTFADASGFRWGRGEPVGHWHDRKNKQLEDYLDDAMAALAAGAIGIKHRLAVEAEKERREEEAREAQRREHARRARAIKRHEFLLKKAEEYARYERLAAFAEHMEKICEYENEPVDRLVEELKSIITVLEKGFGREALSKEIAGAQLYTSDDSLAEFSDE